MRFVTAITFFLPLICLSKSLECGIGQIKHDRLGKTIELCLRNNKTLARLWDRGPISTSSSESDSSSSESDDAEIEYRHRRATAENKTSTNKSTQKSEQTTTESSASASSNENSEKTSDEHSSSNETTTTSTTCIVQCIFENMNMTDNNGFPDHQKIIDGLTSTATRREMKDFLQDTAVECFDEIEKEKDLDSCTYSADLINCLADKGKENCADWPVGNLPF